MFSVIEGLADGGVKMGLPRDLSIRLAAHTLLGASKMVLETGIHPAILKDAVQSPAGSSVYGIHELERGNLKATLISAVEAATNRSKATGSDNLPRQSMLMRGNVYDSSTYTKSCETPKVNNNDVKASTVTK